MVSLEWCKKQKNGIELVKRSDVIANSYMNMAEESIQVLSTIEKSKLWTATTAYYIFYYALYACMRKIGFKYEIHACSLLFLKEFLALYFDEKDNDMIHKAFSARIDLQYYTNRPVDAAVIDEVKAYCKQFFIKAKDMLASISEERVHTIRNTFLQREQQ